MTFIENKQGDLVAIGDGGKGFYEVARIMPVVFGKFGVFKHAVDGNLRRVVDIDFVTLDAAKMYVESMIDERFKH